ncbi:MAG: methionyl-tRNA formyltransferase [Candidatus Saccharimonadales bacterium]
MKKISETIVFFGSGPVAAESLELLASWIDIEAVVTKPQPPHHQEPFPVLVTAKRLGLRTFTPNGKAELSEFMATHKFHSQLGVVIDYGFIIKQDVIDEFPLGIINSHFSLLPELRGADPITFSILSGQKQTGISLMLIVQKMDEGPLLAQATYDLPANITTPELTEDLIDLSNQTLKIILPEYLAGNLKAVPQQGESSYSRKLTKSDGQLDFTKPASQLEREIRAFKGWPKSHTIVAGKEVVITKSSLVKPEGLSDKLPIGTISVINKGLYIQTAAGVLVVEALKPAGKPEMSAKDFLNGYSKGL